MPLFMSQLPGSAGILPTTGDWPFWEYKMNALLPAEAYSGGAERRQTVAHGVSRGFPGASRKSPGGAEVNMAQGALSHSPVAPNGAYVLFERCPTADAMGYGLAPLRGFSKCRFSPGTRTPKNGQSPGAGILPASLQKLPTLAGRNAGVPRLITSTRVHFFDELPTHDSVVS